MKMATAHWLPKAQKAPVHNVHTVHTVHKVHGLQKGSAVDCGKEGGRSNYCAVCPNPPARVFFPQSLEIAFSLCVVCLGIVSPGGLCSLFCFSTG